MRPLQKEIIKQLKVKPTINVEEEIKITIEFLKAYLYKHTFLKSYVLGISGGQDSTLVGKLAQMAIDEIRDETGDESYQFIAVRLPYGEQLDESDAQKAIEYIKPDQVLTIDIKPTVETLENTFMQSDFQISDFNKGNIKARQRMIVQYAVAGQKAGAVLGTDHAAESVTGFFTKFGDGSADLMPIWRLDKSQGRQLLQFLKAPAELYLKVPVADLEDNKPMLPDEVALGVSYEDIDKYLEGNTIEDSVAEKIEAWYIKSEHKRRLPITIFDNYWK